MTDFRQDLAGLDKALVDLAQNRTPTEVSAAELLCRLDRAKRSLNLGLQRLVKTSIAKGTNP